MAAYTLTHNAAFDAGTGEGKENLADAESPQADFSFRVKA